MIGRQAHLRQNLIGVLPQLWGIVPMLTRCCRQLRNDARHRQRAAIGAWTAQHPVAEVLEALDKAAVPAGRIYTVADIAADPHYQARGMLQAVEMDDGSTLTVPGIVPKLSATPGQHRRNAPQLGQDTDQILTEMGLTADQIQSLRARGIVGSKA